MGYPPARTRVDACDADGGGRHGDGVEPRWALGGGARRGVAGRSRVVEADGWPSEGKGNPFPANSSHWRYVASGTEPHHCRD